MLQADLQNSEFFRNFLPETIYLLPGEELADSDPVTAEQAATTIPEAPTSTTVSLPEAEAPAANRFAVLGENRKGVVVLVTLPEHEFQQLPKLEFLNKILSAIGLQATDVAYVNNLTGEVANFEELEQLLPINYIISFASRIETILPHDKFTLYKPVKVGQATVVFSQALSMLEHNVEHKKYLWGALKRVFNP